MIRQTKSSIHSFLFLFVIFSPTSAAAVSFKNVLAWFRKHVDSHNVLIKRIGFYHYNMCICVRDCGIVTEKLFWGPLGILFK